MKLSKSHIACIVACLLAAANSNAQEVSQSALQQCLNIAEADRRLACFDALATGNPADRPMAGQESVEQPAADRAPEDAVAAESAVEAPDSGPMPANAGEHTGPDPSASVEPAPAAEAVAPVSAGEPAAGIAAESAVIEPAPETAAPEMPVGEAAPAVVTEPVVAPAAIDDGDDLTPAPASADASKNLGSEHLDDTHDSNDDSAELAVRATVVEVTMQRHKVLHFRLDNGNVWRQIEGRRFSYPRDGPFEVIITRGMMGDYRLRLDEKSPMTRIRRIR